MRTIVILFVLAIAAGCTSTGPASKQPKAVGNSAQVQPGDFVLTQLASRATYGYSATEPIKVGGPEGGPSRERRFLDQLAGPKGEAVTYSRLGSCCPFETSRGFMGTGLLDQYQVYVAGDPVPKILFLNMYDYEQPSIPDGFTSKTNG